jgi:hypothetical protein
MKRAMLLLVATGAAATIAAFAQTPPAAPATRSRGTNYVCGGIGVDDQQAIKAQASRHSLMLTFAANTGDFLADVDVQITDAKGRVVLAATCPAPIMLVDLPGKGTWHVRAQANGLTREKTVTAGGAAPVRATLLWPAAAVS